MNRDPTERHACVRAFLFACVLGAACKAPPVPPAPAVQSPGAVLEFRSPKKVKSVDPVYPAAARAAGQEGDVVLELEISKAGKVTGVKVIRSLSPDFDRAATEAALLWEYTPTIFKGEPALMYLTVTVRFRLPR